MYMTFFKSNLKIYDFQITIKILLNRQFLVTLKNFND